MPRDPSACAHGHARESASHLARPAGHARRRSRDTTARDTRRSSSGDAHGAHIAAGPSDAKGANGTHAVDGAHGAASATGVHGGGRAGPLGHSEVHVVVDNRDDFWVELEAVATLPENCDLVALDNTIRMFVTFCGAYHDQYLRDPHEMYTAVSLLIDSELFEFYNERMVGIMMGDAQENTNPHELYIWYHVILVYGQRRPSLYRSHRKWAKLLPTLGEVVQVDADENNWELGLPPIEARLRYPAITLMYEVCRVQKLDSHELRQFDDAFIDTLFDLVEKTRNDEDERLNYAAIKLIAALNEQFMVHSMPKKHRHVTGQHANGSSSHSALPALITEPTVRRRAQSVSPAPQNEDAVLHDSKMHNRVLVVLMKRLDSSRTFGTNMIFMLNRAEDTSEGMCMQLLILKVLYLLFTTPGTQEYFFTTDLRVLCDVFIRELVDIDEEHVALRHTYLRVLYPLLCHSQLRHDPYKRPQIRLVLQSLVGNEHIRDVDATTKRLVERCLTATEGATRDSRSHSEPRPRHLSPEAAMCLNSVAAALPANDRSPYTGGDPRRVTSLIDVSGALDRDTESPTVSSPTTLLEPTTTGSPGRDSPIDRSGASTPQPKKNRRRAPAPPQKRKFSTASSASGYSVHSEDEVALAGAGSLGSLGSVESVVAQGEKGVPPPIIEVQGPPQGWITFNS